MNEEYSYIDRMIDEYNELQTKIWKAEMKLVSREWDIDESDMLAQQLVWMISYANALKRRIENAIVTTGLED